MIVNEEGIKPNPKRLEAVVNILYPTAVKKLQKALRSFNWVRRSILNLSILNQPLNELLQKDITFRFETKILRCFTGSYGNSKKTCINVKIISYFYSL